MKRNERIGPRIQAITPGGLAENMGWRVGDRLWSINGHPVEDILDLLFYEMDEELRIEVIRAGREKPEPMVVMKDSDTSLGLDLEPLTVRSCGNNCVFCFVHQQPRGLRKSLYVKDEDYRFSFLHGNFVTLSHVTDAELERIVRLHLSPLYISVHATDEMVRHRLLGRKAPAAILKTLEFLAGQGIVMHTQVVLCPGYNDGEVLEQTIADLEPLFPQIQSLAIVPVGLTCHRQKLPPLRSLTVAEMKALIRHIRQVQKRYVEKFGIPWIYLSDEFYLRTAVAVPSRQRYDDFPQVENGVGLVRLFLDSFRKRFRKKNYRLCKNMVILTGTLFAPLLKKEFLGIFGEQAAADLIIPVTNATLGSTVTVAGLLSGTDLLPALRAIPSGWSALVPDVCFNPEGLTIDGLTLEALQDQAGRRVIMVESTGRALARAITTGSEQNG